MNSGVRDDGQRPAVGRCAQQRFTTRERNLEDAGAEHLSLDRHRRARVRVGRPQAELRPVYGSGNGKCGSGRCPADEIEQAIVVGTRQRHGPGARGRRRLRLGRGRREQAGE